MEFESGPLFKILFIVAVLLGIGSYITFIVLGWGVTDPTKSQQDVLNLLRETASGGISGMFGLAFGKASS